jgi:hypothetical protein
LNYIHFSFRYDLDQPSFSPAGTDDSFFLVRYLKQDTVNEKQSGTSIKNKTSEDNSSEKPIQHLNKMPPALIVSDQPEYKGHTLACQRFITNACGGKLLLFCSVTFKLMSI